MIRRPPRSTRTDTLFPYTTLFRSGQQQRLCIGRAIAVEPEVILMDEPCSALDPIATAQIEELIHELRGQYAIVIVTHNMQQAARVSQRTALFHLGTLVDYGVPSDIRSEERRVGRVWASTCRLRGSPNHQQKKKKV